MKFFPPTDEPVSVNLTSGHTANILPEGTELDPMFHREAIARGCTPEGIEKPKAPDTKPEFDRNAVVRKALNDMLDGQDPHDFKKDGTPDLRAVTKRVGFQVSREDVEANWAELTADDKDA